MMPAHRARDIEIITAAAVAGARRGDPDGQAQVTVNVVLVDAGVGGASSRHLRGAELHIHADGHVHVAESPR